MSRLNPISEERKKERRDAVIKELKSLIFPSIILLIIAGLVFFVMTYQAKDTDEEIIAVRAFGGDDKPIVMENKDIKFEMDPLTTQFTVTVKSSGKVWHSEAQGAETDPLATAEIKNRLQSTLLLTFSKEEGLITTYDSKAYSVDNGIYEIETGEDYVKVLYSLGKVEKEYVIPLAIKASDFEGWLGKMEKKPADYTKQFYKKIDYKKLKDAEKEEYLEKYPIIENEVIYILRDSAKEDNKKTMQKYFEAVGYTYEDFVTDKELAAFESVSDKPIFNASVIYRLDGDDLVVEVPFDELEGKEKLPIYNISVLPFFGAVGTEAETGYLFVPEGGGSIINVNNGKTAQSAYAADLYGRDKAISKDAIVHETEANFNVFGASDGNDSFICMLEDGASYAMIKADIAGKETSYNYVNAVYTVKSREQYEVGEIANSDVFVYIENLPDESLVQRYSFVDSGNYVDMATDYRDYLKNKYSDTYTLNDGTSTPVAVEVLGAVDKVKQIFGIPVSRPLTVTEFDEASEMVDELLADGVDNLSVRYVGWCNGGVNQKILKNVKVLSNLGGKKDLKEFVNSSTEKGVDVYLNGVTNYAYQSDIFDGFFSYTDAAKFLSKKRAELHKYSAITYAARENFKNYYLLHGSLILEMIDNLDKATTKYNANIAFEDVGFDLSSDFYKKDYVSREQALKNQVDKLSNISASGKKIMILAGNEYAVPYVDVITDMDLKGSEYTIIDETVPFYQIALHGYVDYTGKSINLSGNIEEAILTAAEYGAGLSFTFMKESPFTLQKTLYTQYYGADFDAIWEELSPVYNRFNNELGHIYNQEMVNHENISESVSMTEYADGTKVYVNYGYYEYQGNGVKVPGRDYLVVR